MAKIVDLLDFIESSGVEVRAAPLLFPHPHPYTTPPKLVYRPRPLGYAYLFENFLLHALPSRAKKPVSELTGPGAPLTRCSSQCLNQSASSTWENAVKQVSMGFYVQIMIWITRERDTAQGHFLWLVRSPCFIIRDTGKTPRYG
jgi:hypothetical protein